MCSSDLAKEVVEVVRYLTGKDIEYAEIDHQWVHEQLLGYKLLGVLSQDLT